MTCPRPITLLPYRSQIPIACASMKLNAIRDFLVIAKRGSLRAAARELGTAQPAISRGIQDLEKELGVTLFERRAKGVVLTPMGEVFLRRAKVIHSEVLRSKEELDQLRGEVGGQIRVCLSSAAHMAMLPNAMPAFRQRFPKVVMDIIDAVLPVRVENELKDGTVDCYIGPVVDRLPIDLSVEKLFDNARVIIGRRGHPLSEARSLRDLVDADWVTTSITHRAEAELEPLFERNGLPAPRLVVKAHSALTFFITVAHSDLLMMLPVQWTQSSFPRGALQQIHIAEPLPTVPICIVTRVDLPLTPAAEYFCDMMRRASKHMETLIE